MIKEKDIKLIFKDYCLYFQKRLSKRIEQVDFKGIKVQLSSLYEGYYNDILQISIYTLTYELNNERINGRLVGENSRARFKNFEDKFSNEQSIIALLEKYKVLNYLIQKKENQTINFLSKIFSDLNDDKQEIENIFGIKISEITDIKLGQGDTHNNGKTVVILGTKDNKLVYKPHSLNPDVFMNKLIEKINSGLNYELDGIKVLSKFDHGYQEYKSYCEPFDTNDCKKLYYRLGAYLGLFYIMNSSDMHYENIIISKDMPYIIDTETLMNPSTKLYKNQEEYSDEYNTFEDSVLITCLLPYKTEDGLIDMDISGLFGGTISSKKIKTTKINDLGLDTMSITREFFTDHIDNKQNKSLRFDVLDFRDNFIAGFRDIMKFILSNKNTFINYFDDPQLNNMYFRQVLRATMVYARFLEASYNPEYLENFDKRKNLFETLAKNNEKTPRIIEEIRALENNDIPCFEICYADNALYSDKKLVDLDFFLSTPQETVLETLEQLDKNTIDFQIELIKCSFMTKLSPLFLEDNVSSLQIKNTYKSNSEIYNSIFNKFKNKEFYNFNTKGLDLLMCKLLPDDRLVTGINISLYEGIGMLLSYLYYLDKYDNNKEGKKFLNNIINQYQYKKESLQCNVYDGIGSYIYFLFNVYRLYNEQYLYDQYILALDDLIKNLKNNNSIHCDLMYGISGLIIMLYKIYQCGEKSTNLNNCIELSIDILQKQLEKNKDECFSTFGLGHGISGVILACAIAFKFTGNNYFKDKQEEMKLIEEKLLETKEPNNTWCRGLGGIILSKVEILKIQNKKSSAYLEKLLNIFLNQFYEANSTCLCHGFAGNIEVLNIVNNNIKLSDSLQKEVRNKLNTAYKYIDDTDEMKLGLNRNYQLDSFMLGKSGVAYAFLRLDYPDLPSLMILDV